jgi:CrcB protein
VQLFPSYPGGERPIVLVTVAAGGALGATGRWAIAELWAADPALWEWSILIVNVVGSLAIGVAAKRLEPGTTAWSFAVTGVLGGFTTFSAFALALNDLVDAGRTQVAVLYGAVTLLAGIVAVVLASVWTPARPAPEERR